MRKIKQLETLNTFTKDSKKALEQEGYKVNHKFVIHDPVTDEIIETGWEMRLK